MKFELCTAPRIICERDGFARIGELVAAFGKQAMVVRGDEYLDRAGTIGKLEASFAERGVTASYHLMTCEPTVSEVDAAADRARVADCDVVVGLGGGSAMDAAKAVAGLLTHEGSALDYLEVVGLGKPITRPAAPLIAVPTTAGTGAEVTRNAVITCEEKSFKASMRSPHLIPRVALVDPALCHSAPADVTASTGLDALTQLIEPYVCIRAQPLTDALALTGIRRVARSLRCAVQNGEDAEARDDMSLAALLSGICLANAGLGAVHGFAAPLGARFPVPHGVACAALLPHVMAANVAALREHAPESAALRRYADVAEAMLGHRQPSDAEAIDASISHVTELVKELGIAGLSKFGLQESHIPDLVALAKRASSMRANPLPLSDEALRECLRRAL